MSTPTTENPLPGAFRVGEWLVEPSLNRVSRGGAAAQLELKVMEVLVCLARHAPTVVAKNEIIDTVWQTEYISVNTLTHAIAELRRAFSDDARNPHYIETITKRGYRLMQPVEMLGGRDETPSATQAPCFALVVGGHETVLYDGENLLGRAVDSALRIDEAEVSRHHARITVSALGAVLEDLGSKNGTRLWGERIRLPTPLRHGDEITIGKTLIVFRTLVCDGATRTAVDPS